MNVKKKRQVKRWLLPMLMCMFLFVTGGCDSNEEFESFDGYETLKLSEWNSEWDAFFKDSWELYVEFKNQSGWVRKNLAGNLGIVVCENDKYVNFFPQNISQNLLEEDMEVIFSGEVRAPIIADIYPLPLILKNIQVKKHIVIK